MGIIDALTGSNQQVDSNQSEENKYAILLNAGPDETPVAGNAFNYALELDEAGYETELYLDGRATKWPAEFRENPDRPYNYDWEKINERGLLAGACGFCANAFEVADSYEDASVDLLSDENEHAPAIAQLAEDDYEILTL